MPRYTSFDVISVLKPLLDGIIASFHVHNGANLQEVTARLSAAMKKEPEEIGQLLMDSSKAVLGNRDLIQPYRSGVKWNPADDRLVHVEMVIEEYDETVWTIGGKLFIVSPGSIDQ